MCDPVTIAATISIVSTVAQGYQAKQQGKFEQGVSRFNARQLENEATQTRNVGIEQENKQREATAQLASRQRAQIAASGVQLDTGSALNIQKDTQLLGEVDALRIRSNFSNKASALEQQSKIEISIGNAKAKAGSNAFTGSLLAVGVGLGAGAVASGFFTSESSAVATSGTTTNFFGR